MHTVELLDVDGNVVEDYVCESTYEVDVTVNDLLPHLDKNEEIHIIKN